MHACTCVYIRFCCDNKAYNMVMAITVTATMLSRLV